MVSYGEEFNAALERTERLGLRTPSAARSGQRWVDARFNAAFPFFFREALGDVRTEDVVAQCFSLHHRLVEPLSVWLGCPVLYTLGWVDDGTPQGLFRFDEAFIVDQLRTGLRNPKMNIHAWLTLPSMEVIDVTLPTSVAILQGSQTGHGGVVAMHADELKLKGMAYRPMLVGDDFLLRIGALVEAQVLLMT